MNLTQTEFDVIILGGGITGAGTARDCAMRGLKVLLIEKGDISNGATGRNHGLLHSGARYAVTDRESAEECIRENRTLKAVAPHCVEDTSGLFVTLPEDDLGYQETFVKSCIAAGIEAEVLDPKEAVTLEPSVNQDIIGAVRVPDGAVDPFKLCAANILDARLHGAVILTYHEVCSFIRSGVSVIGVQVRDLKTGETMEFRAPVTVNACGIWGQKMVRMAGAELGMFPAKGSMLIYSRRVNKMAINRCRKPANADILVPGGPVCVIGTTSSRVPSDQCDRPYVTPEEVDELLREGVKLAPVLASTRILRAYAGVRPLVSVDNDPSGRNVSRGFVCIDHETRDGIGGFVTIAGGKLTSYRLMAEKTADLVCAKLNVVEQCRTAVTLLPDPSCKEAREEYNGSLVCECERISEKELRDYASRDGVDRLSGFRRRSRFGMGVCQGILCACRASVILADETGSAEGASSDLRNFMCERWKGLRPVAWGDTLREVERTQWINSEIIGINETER